MTPELIVHAGLLLGLVILIGVLIAILGALRKQVMIQQYNQSTGLRLPFQNFAVAVAQHEDLASVYYRGLQGFTGLGAEEQVRFFMIATLVFNYWNEVYEQSRAGAIPQSTWDRVQKMMRDFVRYPGVQQYWGFRRHWFSADVQKVIDELIEDAGKSASSMYPEPSA
jgi:hypothetical protein